MVEKEVSLSMRCPTVLFAHDTFESERRLGHLVTDELLTADPAFGRKQH